MNIFITSIVFQFLKRYGGFSRRGGNLLWKQLAKTEVLERTWHSLRNRFLRCILPNLANYKVTEAELIAADEKAKDAAVAARGRAWSESKRYTEAEDEAILSYITTNKVQSKTGGNKLWKKMEEEEVVEGRGYGRA